MDELIVWLCLTCGWTYEYSREFATKTPVHVLNAFVEELKYQKAVEDYRMAQNFAILLTVWANAQKRGNHFRMTDFIGQPPHRKAPMDKLKKAAEKEGIKTPEDL